MAGKRYGIKREEVAVLISRKPVESGGKRRDLLVAYQGAIEARGATVGQDVGDGVVHSVIRRKIAGPVIALDVEGLRRILQRYLTHGILRGLGGRELDGFRRGGNLAEVAFDDRE